MKQELIQLAKDKGFVATFVHDKPFIYSSKEPLRWLFWMTELQKWLREVQNIYTSVSFEAYHFHGAGVGYYATVDSLSSKNQGELLLDGFTIFSTYEQAFEEGLFEALKLLKDE